MPPPLLPLPTDLRDRGAVRLVSVLIVGLSYRARNVLSYTRHVMHFLGFRDSPIILLRRSLGGAANERKGLCEIRDCGGGGGGGLGIALRRVVVARGI